MKHWIVQQECVGFLVKQFESIDSTTYVFCVNNYFKEKQRNMTTSILKKRKKERKPETSTQKHSSHTFN